MPSSEPAPRLGYLPAFDGLRGLAVAAVLVYHGGFSWAVGGFLGVEVFFVVSGFLITSLLLAEREGAGRIDIGRFWLRRARRLLPALIALLVGVAVWVAAFGSAAQVDQVRRDVPWAVFYAGNWGQIVGEVPYFAGEPSLLRHLWSLAVEEQWYVVWPLVFAGLAVMGLRGRLAAVVLAATAFGVMVLTAVLAGGPARIVGGVFDGADRTNLVYLSTFTRCSGLLLGAAAAFVWQAADGRNRRNLPAHVSPRRTLLVDVAGTAALTALALAVVQAELTAGYVYRWVLPLVSTLSVLLVAVGLYRGPSRVDAFLASRPLVAIGRRSYGLYLYSWPIFVVVGAVDGSWPEFAVAMVLSVLVTEVSYRLLEMPIRTGALGRWWQERPRGRSGALIGTSVAAVAAGLGAFYVLADRYDPFVGGEAIAFDQQAVTSSSGDSGSDSTASSSPRPPASAPAPAVGTDGSRTDQAPHTTSGAAPPPTRAVPTSADPGSAAPDLADSAPAESVPAAPAPVSLALVGDSQAIALGANLPSGLDVFFPTITNGAVAGCSVHDSGELSASVPVLAGFAHCGAWRDDWVAAATDTDVALVTLGAWDVLDLVIDGRVVPFASPEADQRFAAGLLSGIDALREAGANVALLEVPCMTPIDVPSAGAVAIPERGDDDRVAHVNGLLRQVADVAGDGVEFVAGPPQWCADESIGANPEYRTDGVHVRTPGANLVMETIAGDLLRIGAA